MVFYPLYKWSLKVAEMWILVGWWAGLVYLLFPLAVGIPAGIRKYKAEKAKRDEEFWNRLLNRPSQSE